MSTPKSILDREAMKSRREALGLTQERAAELASFRSRQQWNEIEAGRQTNIALDTLSRIAKALDCDPHELLAKPPAKRARRALAAAK